MLMAISSIDILDAYKIFRNFFRKKTLPQALCK